MATRTRKATNPPIQDWIVIVLSKKSQKGHCEICGKAQPVAPGPMLTIEGVDPICESCGQKHAPVLQSLMKLGAMAAFDYGDHVIRHLNDYLPN